MELLGVYFLASTSLALMGSTVSASAGAKPEWLDALRELIFKTISPSPSANNELYKSFLEAPFYGVQSNEPKAAATSLLARGDVYYSTTKGRWILCQDGCTDCAECLLQSKPSLKWSLRRRESAFNSSSRELQLTVVPQLDDSFHMRNLRRRSHVYVTLVPRPPQSSSRYRPELSKRSAGPKRANQLGGRRSIAATDRSGRLVKRTLESSKPLTRRRKQLLRVSPRLRQLSSSRPAAELCAGVSGEGSRDAIQHLEDAPPPPTRGNATAAAAAADTDDRLSLQLLEPTRPTSSDNQSFPSDPADLSPAGRDTSRDPRGIIGLGSVVEKKAAAAELRSAVSRLASKATKARRNRKLAAETRKPKKKKTKRKAIESANPIEDNRLKGTAAPGLAGLKIEAAAKELRASSNSDTRAEMEREIARSGEQRGSIRRRRF